MGLDLFANLADEYDRKARLAPPLLAFIPPFGVAVGLYGIAFPIEKGLIGFLASFGIFYLLASITRALGRRLENRLFDSWGGKPTTQLLRHTDQTIDPITKVRYHAFLSKQINVAFPSPFDERNDASSADLIYTSGVKWLLDRTRDQKTFYLLFRENIAYGFYRNCLGLKPLAIAIACASMIWVVITRGVVTAQGFEWNAFLILPGGAWTSLSASALMLVVWLWFFTQQTVRAAAFTYADRLLRACDVLSQKPDPD